MGAQTEMVTAKAEKRVVFNKNFYLKQAVIWGLLVFVGSTVSALTPSPQQAAAPAAPAAAQQAQQDFPDNPGKETFLRTCGRCHSPSNVLANGQDRDGWTDTITKMVGFGATGTDEEFSEVLDYLTKSFPPVSAAKINVNKATAEQLQTGLTISLKNAQGIVDYRQKNGDFKTLDDLKKVPGIDTANLDLKKGRLTF